MARKETKVGWAKIKEDFEDPNELMAQCKIECDQALIKFYESKHGLIKEFDDVKNRWHDLQAKIDKIGKDEEKIIKDWLANYDQLEMISKTAAHKAGLMKIAIKNKVGDFTGRQTWNYQKLKDLFAGLDLQDGYVEAKDVMDKMAAQSADIVVKRLSLIGDDIKKVLKDAKSKAEKVVGVKLDEKNAIQKVKGQRPSYRLNVNAILDRAKAAEDDG